MGNPDSRQPILKKRGPDVGVEPGRKSLERGRITAQGIPSGHDDGRSVQVSKRDGLNDFLGDQLDRGKAENGQFVRRQRTRGTNQLIALPCTSNGTRHEFDGSNHAMSLRNSAGSSPSTAVASRNVSAT